MSLLLGKEIGQERIAREILLILVSGLSAALDAEDAKWASLDATLAAQLGINYTPCLSNKILSNNFYLGHKPSLIEAPITNYPNLSVIANQIVPSTDQGDQYEGFLINIGIEAMCIDGPYNQQDSNFNRDGEELVNKKTQRMAESIHNVMISNSTVNGLVEQITQPPRVLFSDVQLRRETNGSGSDFYWQMVRLDYQILKISSSY